jgi:hypothetical protein
MGEVLRFLAAELDVPEPPSGAAAASGSGAASETAAASVSGAASGGANNARGGDKRCSNSRLLATGFHFSFPSYREGYRAVLAGEGVRHP